MATPLELRGAVALVTGAGAGIGRATALALATEGAHVLVTDVDLPQAKETVIAIEATGGSAEAHHLDVTDAAAVRRLAEHVSREHGALDVLVCNAGVGMSGRLLDMTLDDWAWIRSVNLDGVLLCCHQFGAAMVERGRGRVVLVSSGLGYTPRATEPAYVTTKAAVLALANCLRADWGERGVGVSAVCPGVINTGIIDTTRFVGVDTTSIDRHRKLFRRGHKPERVATAIVRAIRRDKAVVPVGWEARLGWLSHRYAPIAVQQRVARAGLTKRQRQHPGQPATTAVPTSDGALLATLVEGDGPTIVLAHCWSGSMDTWSPVAQRLVERGYRVIRYDQRGHRSSTVGAEGVTVARLGADLRDVLEAFDVRHAVVAGHSMGGMAVQAFAIDHPDVLAARVDRLVLVATASSSLKRPGLDRLVPFAVAGAATQRLLASPGGHVIVRRVFGRGAEAAAVRATRDAYVATVPDIRLACLRSIFDMDLRAGRATIAAPTTVVVGARDRLTPPSHARGMARDIPGARLVELPHVGHMLPYEAPEEVTDLIAGAAL